jgi:hypothetical protein
LSAPFERSALLTLIALLLVLGHRSHPSETLVLNDLPPFLPSNYGVLGVRVQMDESAVVIVKVRVDSPAERAGLQAGDQILAVLPFRIRSPDDFSRCVQSHLPGAEISILVRRHERESVVYCRVTDVASLYPMMGMGQVSVAPPDSWLPAGLEPGLFEAEVAKLLVEHNARQIYDGLLTAFEMELGRYGDSGRLPSFQLLMQDPLKVPAFARATSASLETAMHLEEYIELTWTLGSTTPWQTRAPAAAQNAGLPPQSQLNEFLSVPLTEANEIVHQALAALDSDDQKHVLAHWPSLLNRLSTSHYLDEGTRTETITHTRTLALLQKVNQRLMLDAALRIAVLAEDSAVQQIVEWVEPLASLTHESSSDFRGDLLFRSTTPYGTILVGGDGPNYYGADAALIIDLGGDDVYSNNCGAPPSAKGQRIGSVGIIVDLDGNDRYLATADGALGSGVAGIGMLIDKGGDDIYQGANLTQGSGLGGVGVVWDASGNDIYIGEGAAQAAAFYGVGLLVDERGDDFYSAWQIAQGFGGSGGVALLHDRSGNDFYLADEKVPSLYAQANEFSGWAQGVGCGFRGFTPGGIGILVDRRGDDQYQGGDFSQGIGYFFGLGLLHDGEGDDEYRGGRYAQGAAAHQAIGVAVDAAGNDIYSATAAASQGSAWDASIGILEDLSGDDRYRGGTLCQGAASMNSLGILLDRGGSDSYLAQSGQGYGGGTRYWGGRNAKNVGILVDLDGVDHFNRHPQGAQSRSLPESGLFVNR